MKGKHESTKQHGSCGRRVVLWLLLTPLLVLVVLKTDFLPQAAHCKSPFHSPVEKDQFCEQFVFWISFIFVFFLFDLTTLPLCFSPLDLFCFPFGIVHHTAVCGFRILFEQDFQ